MKSITPKTKLKLIKVNKKDKNNYFEKSDQDSKK